MNALTLFSSNASLSGYLLMAVGIVLFFLLSFLIMAVVFQIAHRSLDYFCRNLSERHRGSYAFLFSYTIISAIAISIGFPLIDQIEKEGMPAFEAFRQSPWTFSWGYLQSDFLGAFCFSSILNTCIFLLIFIIHRIMVFLINAGLRRQTTDPEEFRRLQSEYANILNFEVIDLFNTKKKED